MDKTTWLGIILAVIAVGVAIVIKGVNLGLLLNYPALLIIFVGTFASVLVAFPMKDIKKVGRLTSTIFIEKEDYNLGEIIKDVARYSDIARREGLMTLEAELPKINNPFLQNALALLVEGLSEDELREVLEEDINAKEERHEVNRGIFTQAGTYAPTLGVLGAVVGLIAALANMQDIEKLSLAICAAFVATLFGIFTGYVLWHPFANKLKRKSEEEILVNTAMMEGVLAIQANKPKGYVVSKMVAYLPTSERDTILEAIKNGKKA